MSFRYILRYLIDPDFNPEARIRELTEFCKSSFIEEVMLFVTPEELSTGHPTSEELERYIWLGKELKSSLDREGIALSLNPWSTIYHNFRGRKLRDGQDFRLMVGETGVQNPVAVCPLCPEWQSYLEESFCRLVREIQPVTLWIEDDWRLMNHDVRLGWGGCFCKEHLNRFSAVIGGRVTHQELINALLQPGPPHAWRRKWMEFSNETLVVPLARIAQAVRKASPRTQVALMSSNPDSHSVEGRVWRKFQEAVGCQPTFMTRPNMAPYTQTPALSTPPTRTRMTLANLVGPLSVYPELENAPRCGVYSKSAAYSAWQMMNCAFFGSHGITINHYDMLGNGISLDEAFGKELCRRKPFLNALAGRGVDDREADGVTILFSPDVSGHLHLTDGNSLSALMQESSLPAEVCAILGIAYRFSASVETATGPVFVSGQTLRALSRESLKALFQKEVILDADAVLTALDLGINKWIGISDAELRSQVDTAYSYEEIWEDNETVYGLAHPRMTAQRCSPVLLSMQAAPGAEVLTQIYTADHRALWPGSVMYRNPNGGTVVCMAYPYRRIAQFFMGYFNRYRRIFLQELFWKIAPNAPLAMAVEHPLHLYRHRLPSGEVDVAVTNPTDDTLDRISIELPVEHTSSRRWEYLNPLGEWKSITPVLECRSNRIGLTFPISLRALEGTVLRSSLILSWE